MWYFVILSDPLKCSMLVEEINVAILTLIHFQVSNMEHMVHVFPSPIFHLEWNF